MIQWRAIFERTLGFFKSLTFAQILKLFKTISLYWGFIWPILYCLSVISVKYWGDDNLFEQTVEAGNKLETGISVDISLDLKQNPEPYDLKRFIPNER